MCQSRKKCSSRSDSDSLATHDSKRPGTLPGRFVVGSEVVLSRAKDLHLLLLRRTLSAYDQSRQAHAQGQRGAQRRPHLRARQRESRRLRHAPSLRDACAGREHRRPSAPEAGRQRPRSPRGAHARDGEVPQAERRLAYLSAPSTSCWHFPRPREPRPSRCSPDSAPITGRSSMPSRRFAARIA